MKRLEMARQIVEWEARRDGARHIQLYRLPANDGGGSYEYAGLNDRFHSKVLAEIVALVNDGKHVAAEKMAVEYVANFTESAASWSLVDAVDLFLRDCAFHRGPGGAAKILQRAVRVHDDGAVGDLTLSALRAWERRPLVLIGRLRAARERYEIDVAGYRPILWRGLENRWDNAFEASVKLLPA